MASSQDVALLVAVNHAVRERTKEKPRRQANGGNVMWWPMVAQVMQHLTGRPWDRQEARKRHRWHTRGLTQAAIDALIATVDPEVYRESVRQVVETGEAPKEAPPVVPGVNARTPGRKPDTGHDEPKETPEETIERIRRESILSDEEAAGRAKQEIEMEKWKARARVAERLAKEYRKRAAFVQDACDMLRDVVVTMPPAQWNPVDVPAVHLRREQDAVLVLSDIHVGDAISADTMGAINVYNYDVFLQKTKRLYAGVKESLEMLREHGNVRKLWILGLGDWVTGTNIFPGQAHHIEFGAMKQAMHGAEEMTRVLYEFLELPGIEQVQVECVPGNHGRPGKKGQDPPEDNWDLVLYEFMRLRLAAQPRLALKWYESWWMMPRIRGWDFLCAHGDEVRAWNGIPNYGFRRWGQKWREMLDSVGKRYDYGLIGHHHVEVEERNLIISGAWPGASFFSAKFLQSGGEATQMFYSVAEDYGITWRRRLPLDPPKRPITEGAA